MSIWVVILSAAFALNAFSIGYVSHKARERIEELEKDVAMLYIRMLSPEIKSPKEHDE